MSWMSVSGEWKGRDAVRLANEKVELTSLTGGGHLADFRFLEQSGCPLQNVLWEAPWTTCDPGRSWSGEMSRLYGAPETGKFLAGFTGHALCLDYFGAPSAEMARSGLGIHGEAACARWNSIGSPESGSARCRLTAMLPLAGLNFEREIRLGEGESVAYVQESVTNIKGVEHECNWVQHVTFGEPFLEEGASTIVTSADSGMTSPFGYDGNSLLPNNRSFDWPVVPSESAFGNIDLRRPFSHKGYGFLAGVRLDPRREVEYLVAINWRLGLGVGYCFRRRDFPWMAIWEENCSRHDAPWSGSTRARGMEFGTTPLPLACNGGLGDPRFSGTPRGCLIPAHGTRVAHYIMFLFSVPTEMRSARSVTATEDSITICQADGGPSLTLPAKGCAEFLA